MGNSTNESKQPEKTGLPHAGWLTRAQAAAELGYKSIFPVRKMEGHELHPTRTARGWLFDPAEIAALKAKRPLGKGAVPAPDGQIAARVFRLFDTGRELREIVEDLEIPPPMVRDLWHEWLTDLDEGEMNRRKSAQEERQRRSVEAERRELDRRLDLEEQNFAKLMASLGEGYEKPSRR